MMNKISKNFTWEEFVASDTAKRLGIINQITDWDARDNIIALVENVLQPLRDAYGKPITINSGYRCAELNKKVGGVATSQHTKGQAADICIDGDLTKGRRWFDYIKAHLQFDQLIWEHDKSGTYWIHVSYVPAAYGRNRKQVIDNLLKK